MTFEQPRHTIEEALDQTTGEFSLAEEDLVVAEAKLEKAGNFLTRGIASVSVRAARRKVGRLYEEGEGLDEVLLHSGSKTRSN